MRLSLNWFSLLMVLVIAAGCGGQASNSRELRHRAAR